jgi:hypothetical protein
LRSPLPLLFLAFATLLSSVSHAGPGISGGGDQCENRVKSIGEDISVWIVNGGHQNLKLPTGLSSQAYAGAMSAGLKQTRVSCVGKGDPGYPVEIFGTPKICRFDVESRSSRITCDFEKFRSLTDEEQYSLVHHEYAGIAGLEPAVGDNSQYAISNQIAAFLEETIVKKLAVKQPIDEKALCAAGITEFVRKKFPVDKSTGRHDRIWGVNVDKVSFNADTGQVDIEAHALFDQYGYSATRVFIDAESIWTEPPSGMSEPAGCKAYRVKASFSDPLADGEPG